MRRQATSIPTAGAIAALNLLAVLSVAGPARASEVRFNLAVEGSGLWVPRLPDMDLSSSVDTPARTVPARPAPLAGGVFLMQTGLRVEVVINDRIVIPFFGVAMGGAVGSAPDVATSIDGTTFVARSANAIMARFDLPGIGVRLHERRWAFDLRAIPSIDYWAVPAIFTGSVQGNLGTLGLTVRADVSVCYRADPYRRVCAFVAPSLWSSGVLNGGTAGLRLEFGP
ncbi:MAG: hypothetical protein WCJ30_13305 [Deltaproteobacteria bacterium]